MLQHQEQLSPLALSPPAMVPFGDDDYVRANDPARFSPALPGKPLQKESLTVRSVLSSLPHHLAFPLSIASNTSSPTSSSSSPASAKFPRSPYISSRAPSRNVTNGYGSRAQSAQTSSSSVVEDVLAPGDCIGEDLPLQGELVRLVPLDANTGHSDLQDFEEPSKEFEVVRQLGTGSYAVVFLVREVLARSPPSEDGHISTVGPMDLEGLQRGDQTVYGREFAIKCLSKANLDEDDLMAQMTEVTIHQSLKRHPNIVTLYRTLETSSFLLLLLEYVPGEDLFYFLEQARDHYDSNASSPSDSLSSFTPPTPSLLSSLHPSQLLSSTRLRLISSMFSQMCDAVAACHLQHVFHRDIKPENFIVTDGWTTGPNGRQDRKVVVKLTDFGLSTTDVNSCDMDCGSAPYMSYECRNNIAPTYRPRGADVWSLGIVLINMLYHFNPWTDTATGVCSSFSLYRRDPVNFFMNRFTGMTRPVADVLASKVFCILEDPSDDSARFSASDFGVWVRNLPSLLGCHAMQRTVSNSSQGHRISCTIPVSHRPSSRNPSTNMPVARASGIASRSHSRAPSLGPACGKAEPCELSTVIDQENEEEEDLEDLDLESLNLRPVSTNKRRKRGSRKGKGLNATPAPNDDILRTLANASQSLAREISRTTKSSGLSLMAGNPADAKPLQPLVSRCNSLATTTIVPPTVAPIKKPSKWRLSFGKNSSTTQGNTANRVPPADTGIPGDFIAAGPPTMSATASNITKLIKSLDPPSSQLIPATAARRLDAKTPSWNRERRERGAGLHHQNEGWVSAWSPNGTRRGRPLMSSASSVASSNWRSSMSTTSSAATSTSAFTRYSNASSRSISTTSTSISSASWRAAVKPIPYHNGQVPKNISVTSDSSLGQDQLPGDLHTKLSGDVFGSSPARKQRTKKTKDVKLDTINERPVPSAYVRTAENPMNKDALVSTTDLGSGAKDEIEGAKKVQKGQINALAKMLSALRR